MGFAALGALGYFVKVTYWVEKWDGLQKVGGTRVVEWGLYVNVNTNFERVNY